MKAKEISVSTNYRHNLGNYQHIDFFASVTMTVEDGDTVEQVYEKGWEIVGDQINEQLSLFKEEKKSGVKKGL